MFYLGTHRVNWLATSDVPLFVSRRQLTKYKTLPKAKSRYCVDSGGFSELSMFGEWVTTEAEYVSDLRRFWNEIGPFDWAAPMDWMCEPVMLEKTGLTIEDHQWLTVGNFASLRALAPELPIIPVLQGWKVADYHRHIAMYRELGIDLKLEPTVGVGSVCRRQNRDEIGLLFRSLHARGLKLHGFGVKSAGLRKYAKYLQSADSLAWSYAARKRAPMAGCTHKNCANCVEFAMAWRQRLLQGVAA